MDINRDSFTILIADDDIDEFLLLKEGLKECQIDCNVHHVPDGEELMDYLLREEKFINSEQGSFPLFILLDLNMPRKNGWDVLIEIKSSPYLKYIPVIMYTSSREEEDIRQCYSLGANSYIIKPAEWHQFINMIMNLFSYWTQIVRLPKVRFNKCP